jgi:hypothetical protein
MVSESVIEQSAKQGYQDRDLVEIPVSQYARKHAKTVSWLLQITEKNEEYL